MVGLPSWKRPGSHTGKKKKNHNYVSYCILKSIPSPSPPSFFHFSSHTKVSRRCLLHQYSQKMKARSRLPAERRIREERLGIATLGLLGEWPRFPDQPAPSSCSFTENLGQTLRDGQPAIITAQTHKTKRPGAAKC